MNMFWAGFWFGVMLGLQRTMDNVVRRLRQADGVSNVRRPW